MAIDTYIAPKVLQTSHNGKPSFVTLSKFNQTFFSGLDAGIWFQDIYLGQVVQIQYELQERTMPIYSYADFTKAKSVKGARQVSGVFTINFQQAHLIDMLLVYMRDLLIGGDEGLVTAPSSVVTIQNPKTIGIGSTNNLSTNKSSTLPSNIITDITSSTEYGNYIKNRTPNSKKKLINSLTTNTKRLTQDANMQAQIQQSINKTWLHNQLDSPLTTENAPEGSLLSKVRDSLTPFYSRYDLETGFQINIVFGDTHINSNNTQAFDINAPYQFANKAMSHKEMVSKVQEKDVYAALAKSPPYTTQQIVGVDITGFGQVIDDSGRPILQTFSFIASDVI